MACFHPLARRCFPKTRSLRPRSRLLTGLLNMGSQSSHHQSLQLPREEQKSPTKGRNGVSWNIKSWQSGFKYHLCPTHTCDLQDSRGVNVVTYLWDNIWRDIKKSATVRPLPKYSSLGNYFMYADIDTSEIPANRVRSCGLITSAETSLKKVRKASQFMIYHLRMNSVTGLIDSNEKTVF